jgi:hypothetical protein
VLPLNDKFILYWKAPLRLPDRISDSADKQEQDKEAAEPAYRSGGIEGIRMEFEYDLVRTGGD